MDTLKDVQNSIAATGVEISTKDANYEREMDRSMRINFEEMVNVSEIEIDEQELELIKKTLDIKINDSIDISPEVTTKSKQSVQNAKSFLPE